MNQVATWVMKFVDAVWVPDRAPIDLEHLHRPTTRDPEDLIESPEDDFALELDYRVPFSASRPAILRDLLLTSIVCISAMLALRALGVWLTAEFLKSTVVLLPMLFLVSVIALFIWRKGILYVSVLILLWLGLVLIKTVSGTAAYAAMLTLLALLATTILACEMADNYVAWLLVEPKLPLESADRAREEWDRRFQNLGSESVYGVLTVVACILAAMITALLFVPPQLLGLSFAILLLLFLLFATLLTLLYQPNGLRHAVATSSEAVVLWFAYGAARPVPGVFRSPYDRRRLHVQIVLAFLVMSLVPLACYFPLHLALVPEMQWEKAGEIGSKIAKFVGTKPTSSEVPHVDARLGRISSPSFGDDLESGEYGHQGSSPVLSRRASLSRLRETPEAWLLAALQGVFTGDARFPWALITGVIASIFTPVVVLVSILYLVLAQSLTGFVDRVDAEVENSNDKSDFDCYVDRLINSNYEHYDGTRERDHLLLGFDSQHGRPILLARDLLNGHAHILGSTQSGKTSMALSPMLSQMIRGLSPHSPDFREQSSILIIDLKGDPALFHNVHWECEQNGIGFKYFTTSYHDASYAFNPLDQSHLADVSPEQRIDMLTRALGLFYGHDYPEAYWSDKNAQVFRTLLGRFKDIRSFARFYQYARELRYYRIAGGNPDDWKRASHVTAAAQKLAGIVPLNVTSEETPSPAAYRDRIDMRALGSRRHDPQVVYFYIRATDQEASGNAIAKLALYSLLTAINTLPEKEKKRTYVFIDEFQVIAQDVLARLFEQAAGLKVSYVLSNQSLTTLPDTIQEVLAENTAFRQIFRAGSLKMRQFLRERSGESIYHRFTLKLTGEDSNFTIEEQLGPTYRDTDIAQTSYDRRESWVEMSAPRGFSRYGGSLFTIHTDFHITEEEYDRRTRLTWPPKTKSTFVASEEEHILRRYGPATFTAQTRAEMANDIDQLDLGPIAPTRNEPLLPKQAIQPFPEFEAQVAQCEQAYDKMINNVMQGSIDTNR